MRDPETTNAPVAVAPGAVAPMAIAPGAEAATHFGLPTNRVWLNASHQGPLSLAGAAAVQEMVEWKLAPHHLQTPTAFSDGQDLLRARLAALVNAKPSEIVLANSASYGLHLVANGLQLTAGDEVVVAANDFPSDILPWMRLADAGVVTRQIAPAASVVSADEVRSAITARTRAVCLPWVHSFSGQRVDLDAVGEVCREADVLLVVNASQGLGAIPFDVTQTPVDVVISVGHKWLVGPYGSGMCWLSARANERIAPTKLYWLSSLTIADLAATDLDLEAAIAASQTTDAKRHDVFGTANFFNFSALSAGLELVNTVGPERIFDHNLSLTAQLVAGLDQRRWEILDRGDPRLLTSIVFLRPRTMRCEDAGAALRDAGIDIAVRTGCVRISPHFYNTPAEIAQALEALNRLGA